MQHPRKQQTQIAAYGQAPRRGRGPPANITEGWSTLPASTLPQVLDAANKGPSTNRSPPALCTVFNFWTFLPAGSRVFFYSVCFAWGSPAPPRLPGLQSSPELLQSCSITRHPTTLEPWQPWQPWQPPWMEAEGGQGAQPPHLALRREGAAAPHNQKLRKPALKSAQQQADGYPRFSWWRWC